MKNSEVFQKNLFIQFTSSSDTRFTQGLYFLQVIDLMKFFIVFHRKVTVYYYHQEMFTTKCKLSQFASFCPKNSNLLTMLKTF